jgi:hypothetical protein
MAISMEAASDQLMRILDMIYGTCAPQIQEQYEYFRHGLAVGRTSHFCTSGEARCGRIAKSDPKSLNPKFPPAPACQNPRRPLRFPFTPKAEVAEWQTR